MLGSISAAVLAVPAVAIALSDTTIVSAGPLDQIIISDELNCQVSHTSDEDFEFYPPTVRTGACATQIHVDGVTYGPSDLPAAPTPARLIPVSQSPVTGSGSAADPYQILTVVDVGTTGLRLTQSDTYVVGRESYRTDVVIDNNTDTAQQVILYRAGDCHLQQSDFGFGAADPSTGAVSCVGTEDEGASPGDRIIQWYPLTPGSNYVEGFYAQVWSLVDLGLPFPDTVSGDFLDNGAGLSWSLNIPAGESTAVAQLMVVSPLGTHPLTTSKTADEPTSLPGTQNGYTIEVRNPNTAPATLDSITDVLPTGFRYVPGSTTGATGDDPAITDQELRWSGPLVVAPQSTLTIHFDVHVSTAAGTYYNEAAAQGSGLTVIATGRTASIVVAPTPRLVVEKTATTSYTRTWTWSIDKTADTNTLSLSQGEQASVAYRVDVDATPTDAAWTVRGSITISNPTSVEVLVESVVDEVPGVGVLPVTCPGGLPQPVQPGGTLVCTYAGILPDGSSRLNRAVVTTGDGPVAGGSAEVDVEFGAPSSEVDRSIVLTDSVVGSLGSIDAAAAPASVVYSSVVGPFDCGSTHLDNTARFVTSDTSATGSATWRVAVTVACSTCTQGTGYWKNRSEYGPATYDPMWGRLPEGASTELLGSGDSWYEVFQTNPKGGNAWYLLAHPYMSARLNELSGAPVPAEVATALAEAQLLLTRYATDQVIPKKSPDRGFALALAGVLGEYNSGAIGPGSC